MLNFPKPPKRVLCWDLFNWK